MGDFSQRTFEVQVRYNTGWETISRPSPFYAHEAWENLKQRYRTIPLRLLVDGKVAREKK